MFTAPDICVGQPGIVFYERAERGNGPAPCLVTRVSGNGICDLTVFRPGYMALTLKSGCRHINDPFLADHPEAAQNCGAWDFCDSVKEGDTRPNGELKLGRLTKVVAK